MLLLSGWPIKYGKVSDYLKKIVTEPEIHKRFLRAVEKWIERHNADPTATRIHSCKDMVEAMTVTSEEVSGDRALMRRTFVEKSAYEEGAKAGVYDDPEKNKDVKHQENVWIEEAQKELTGYWVRGWHGNGTKGHYEHEELVSAQVRKTAEHHKGPELTKGLAQDKWLTLKGVAQETRATAERTMVSAARSHLSVDALLAIAGGNRNAETRTGDERQKDDAKDEDTTDEEETSEPDQSSGVFDRHRRAAAKAAAKAKASPLPAAAKAKAPATRPATTLPSVASTVGARKPAPSETDSKISQSDGAADAETSDTKRGADLEVEMDGRTKRIREGLVKDVQEIEDLENEAYDLSFEDDGEDAPLGRGKTFLEQCRNRLKQITEITSKVKACKGKIDRSTCANKEELFSDTCDILVSTSDVAETIGTMVKHVLAPKCAHSDMKESIAAVHQIADDEASPVKLSATFYVMGLEAQAMLKVQFGQHKDVCEMFRESSDEATL